MALLYMKRSHFARDLDRIWIRTSGILRRMHAAFGTVARRAAFGDTMSVVLFALTAFLSTAAGGLFALRFRDQLHLILGFTAGVLLGVVAFDILPEVFELTHTHALDAAAPMSALVG